MKLEFDVFGDVQVDRRLERFADRADNIRPVLSALADDFVSMERRQFASQGAFGSGGWAPLAASTIAYKARAGLDPRILHATHALLDSLTGGKGHVRVVTSETMFVGTSVRYARFHQRGTRRMPRRRPVEFRAQDRRRWVKALQRFLIDGTIKV